MSQAELAEKLGISQQTISKYENGTRQPDFNILKFIADFFDVSTDYLLGRSVIRKPGKSIEESHAYYNFNVEGLPDEAIKQVEDYIEFIKHKYNSK